MESQLRKQQQRAEDVAIVKASRAPKAVKKMKPAVPDGPVRRKEKPAKDIEAQGFKKTNFLENS